VGEPINPSAWLWYHQVIGGERCPIVDTWWQTETGMIMITPLPGVTTTRPGSATLPFPGITAEIVDEAGNPLPPEHAGYLVILNPWPAMARTLYGNPDRFREVYFSRFPGRYFSGDGGKKDKDGFFFITGRVDDVIKVSGHRLSNIELESTFVSHPAVAESAVIARSDPITGEAISAFVVLRSGYTPSESLEKELKEWVAKKIGAIARPKEVFFVSDLPKTRSAKIMRRLLRDIAEGKALGDTTTLTDPGVLEELRQRYLAEGKED
jgi:acetyl-CoA synthetase